MWANNETGVIFPVEKIAEMAKEKGAIFHTDSVQAVGKLPINLKESQIDMLSLSGHKLHAPKGVGVLYVAKGTPFVPFMILAGTRSTAAGPAPKTCLISSVWAEPPSWPWNAWRMRTPG
jgi:cysteine sulfinate desulfinase/cysteine desulfurase-like protein